MKRKYRTVQESKTLIQNQKKSRSLKVKLLQTCACGNPLTCIGGDTARRVKVIPAIVKILEEKKLKYSCKKCEGTSADVPGVITAPGIKHVIPGSIADESFLAWSISEKFEFALPLYRQESRLAYMGGCCTL